MSYLYLPHGRSRAREHGVPWLSFLFVSVALLFIFHWPLVLHRTVDNYNVAEEISVAGMEGSGVREAMLIALGIVAVVSLSRRPADPRLRIDGVMGWLLLAFVAWALMSTMWAQDLSLTLKRLTSFVIICIFAVALARRLSLREILLWTFFTTALFFLVAITFEVVFGIFQPLAYGYRFSGIQHPNGEGLECALLAFSGFVGGHLEKRRRALFVSFGLLGAFFLILTASRTTLAGTALAVGTYSVCISRKSARTLIFPFIGVLASLVLFLTLAGSFQGLESKLFPGRDEGGDVESFAGRTSVWADVAPYIREHPLVGYGYGGFWTPTIQAAIADKEGWDVPDAHSTYVDCVLTLGLVGITLNVFCLAAGLRRAFGSYQRTRDPYFAFLAGLLIFCLIDGFLESSAGGISLFGCLFIITLIRLAFVPIGQPREMAAEAGSGKKNSARHAPYTIVNSF
jgi:exopolysaccharide production protein ExoQ